MVKTKDPVRGKEDPRHVFVQYNMTEEGGEICEGEENDEWPSHEMLYKTHQVLGVFTKDLEQPDYLNYSERVSVEFDPTPCRECHLVLVTYSSGDTFGNSSGDVAVVGVFATGKEAEDVAVSIRQGSYKGYCAWEGYFDRLEGIEVQRFALDEQNGIRRF